MKLVVFSHKQCWESAQSPIGYATDGGFVFHMQAIGTLLESARIVVPVVYPARPQGEVCFQSKNLQIVPLRDIPMRGKWRKVMAVPWFLYHLPLFLRELFRADAVHVPIPGDVGTIGMLLAHVMRKPLFVRHCGNWLAPKTRAEHFWKWYMEKYAGGRNVFLATGGGGHPPSFKNSNIEWIFSTSLSEQELLANKTERTIAGKNQMKLLTVSRQDKAKGTGTAIQALQILNNSGRHTSLDVVGDGPDLPYFKELAKTLQLQDKIHFWGKLNHEEVIQKMQEADIFCYATQASEGFPKVVLEALSCGLPVITNPVSVLPLLIETSQAGIVMNTGTPEDLAEQVLKLANHPDTYNNYSQNALKTASKYSLEAWAAFMGERLQRAWHQH